MGYEGDTLASALIANGVDIVGRSFKYHRPRGILSAGVEESNAVVQLETGAHSLPNLQATLIELHEGLTAASVNGWPSVRLDVGAFNDFVYRLIPSGFYYKTFMWPRGGWRFYERFIRRMSGLGRAPDGPDPDRYEHMNAHCDVLVVGAGPAGLAAATAAAHRGERVILADEDSRPGGSLLNRGWNDETPDSTWITDTVAELKNLDLVRILLRTTVTGYFDHNFLVALERVTDHGADHAPRVLPRQRLWRIRARRVILATGAHERPVVFANNDRPGIMLAGAARAYINRFAVRPGDRALIVTNNDSAYFAVRDFSRAGMTVSGIVDLRAGGAGLKARAAVGPEIEIMDGHAVVDTRGRARVRVASVAPVDAEGAISGPVRRIRCDLIAMSGGWSPVLHLLSQSGGRLSWDGELCAFRPGHGPQQTRCAGAANGFFEMAACRADGEAAGNALVVGAEPAPSSKTRSTSKPLWLNPAPSFAAGERRFVDFQNDVTASDIMLAAREGYESVEHLKRYTTLGMGTDQGKVGNVNGLAILADELNIPVSEAGMTTFRPPYTPVTLGAIAGRDTGLLADPERRTPMQAWHAKQGAEFENVGQWRRPFWYPQSGESRPQAVVRECKAVRSHVGIMDMSSLGKIMLKGPDTAEFLNRIYTNNWLHLPVGRCRYGLMLGEDGMVMDDGVTARLAEDLYFMTTTTGNAATVYAWLEEWLQTEWPELRVYVTSVTEQYASAAIAGPRARDVIGPLTSDIDLAPDAFPFMTWRKGHVAGLPARVFRISYTGEMSYEISVRARDGMALWNAVIEQGKRYDITPFGTEAMHVLRAEKGYILIGQETDGSVTPHDLGLHRLVSANKDFIGKRSLDRAAMRDPARKRLVGLKTKDPSVVLPEGAQLLPGPLSGLPATMIGHVTSSYWSVALNRSIALALVRGGKERENPIVHVALDRGTVEATICDFRFYDPEGDRLHG